MTGTKSVVNLEKLKYLMVLGGGWKMMTGGEMTGIRRSLRGLKNDRDYDRVFVWVSTGNLEWKEHYIYYSQAMGSGSAFFFLRIRDQAVPLLWDQEPNCVTLLESRIRNLGTKMGSAMTKHTLLRP